MSMPVAQIVAGFTKVFVGEMVEKGECRSSFYLSPRDITAPSQLGSNHRIGSQLVQSRSAAEKRDPCLQITCARRTACTRRRPGALAPLGHYAGKSSSRAKRVMDLETPPLPPSRTLQAITRTPIDVSQVDMKYPPHPATPVSNTRRIKRIGPGQHPRASRGGADSTDCYSGLGQWRVARHSTDLDRFIYMYCTVFHP